jgi:hypothetical protein
VAAVLQTAYAVVLSRYPALHPVTANGPAELDRVAAELLEGDWPPGHTLQARQAARAVLTRAISAEVQLGVDDVFDSIADSGAP